MRMKDIKDFAKIDFNSANHHRRIKLVLDDRAWWLVVEFSGGRLQVSVNDADMNLIARLEVPRGAEK